MIFDFFLELNFNNSFQPLNKLSFKGENEYSEIVVEERLIELKNGYWFS